MSQPQPNPSPAPLLAVDDLTVTVPSAAAPDGRAAVVRRFSMRLERGEMVALVGESGCGKTLTALALIGLLPAGVAVGGGSIRLAGAGELTALDEGGWVRLRGARVAMIFQEPLSALNPRLTIGYQLCETLRRHRRLRGAAARREAVRLLQRIAMPDAGRRLRSYAHQLSGGQRQRAMIALALAGEPDLLLADEPTTALDVTIQAQVLALIDELRRELGLAVLLISHDLGVVAGCCERVLVMYAGQVVEEAPAEDLFRRPAHPYTRALLDALPVIGRRGELRGIPGSVPQPGRLPPGCAFAPRCAEAVDRCRRQPPRLVPLAGGRLSRCLLHEEQP